VVSPCRADCHVPVDLGRLFSGHGPAGLGKGEAGAVPSHGPVRG